jgi:hypothetical protein
VERNIGGGRRRGARGESRGGTRRGLTPVVTIMDEAMDSTSATGHWMDCLISRTIKLGAKFVPSLCSELTPR